VYGSTTVTRCINYLMLRGKRGLAEGFVYGALDSAAATLKKKQIEVLDEALANIKPSLEVRSRRVGGASYQVPVAVDENRQEALALRWLVKVVRSKKGKNITELLAAELINACKGEGDAVRMKEETERMAEANKAFAHFRW